MGNAYRMEPQKEISYKEHQLHYNIKKNKSIIHAIMKIQYTAYRDSKENKIIKYCQYYIFSIVLGHNSGIWSLINAVKNTVLFAQFWSVD